MNEHQQVAPSLDSSPRPEVPKSLHCLAICEMGTLNSHSQPAAQEDGGMERSIDNEAALSKHPHAEAPKSMLSRMIFGP